MLVLAPSFSPLASPRRVSPRQTTRFPAHRAGTTPATAPLVLIIDGPSNGLCSLTLLLENCGCETWTAATGQESFAQLEFLLPDVVLLDVSQLGRVEGHDLCRRLKADERYRHLPVLLVDTFPDDECRMDGFKAGAADTFCQSAPPMKLLMNVRSHARTGRQLRSFAEQNAKLRREVVQRHEHDEHLQRSLDRAVVSGVNDRVKFRTLSSQRLLTRYFPDHHEPDTLPRALTAWLAEGARLPWQTERDGCQLQVSLQGNAHAAMAGRPYLLTLAESTPAAGADDGPASLARLGLTPRESEVLYWIAHGKTNPETSMILRTAPNTIKKHMQNIMLKLGVENRLAAASRALEVIGLSWQTC